MSFKSKDAQAAFTKLSLREVRCKHHIKGYFVREGVVYFQFFYSHGSKDVPQFVVEKLARVCGLSVQEFTRFSRCKISRAEYIDMAKQRGIIE